MEDNDYTQWKNEHEQIFRSIYERVKFSTCDKYFKYRLDHCVWKKCPDELRNFSYEDEFSEDIPF